MSFLPCTPCHDFKQCLETVQHHAVAVVGIVTLYQDSGRERMKKELRYRIGLVTIGVLANARGVEKGGRGGGGIGYSIDSR